MLRCSDVRRAANAATTVLAIGLVLLMEYFAASPSLHQRLHADWNRPDHFCAIIAFAKENLSGTASVAIVRIATVLRIQSLPPQSPLISLFDYYFSPDRAPPLL